MFLSAKKYKSLFNFFFPNGFLACRSFPPPNEVYRTVLSKAKCLWRANSANGHETLKSGEGSERRYVP